MYFKYGNKLKYKFDNKIQEIPVTTDTGVREPYIMSLLPYPAFYRYIPNLDLCTDRFLENFDVREAVAGNRYKYDPRIQIYQSIRPYYPTNS
jgi:hypothetical protein